MKSAAILIRERNTTRLSHVDNAPCYFSINCDMPSKIGTKQFYLLTIIVLFCVSFTFILSAYVGNSLPSSPSKTHSRMHTYLKRSMVRRTYGTSHDTMALLVKWGRVAPRCPTYAGFNAYNYQYSKIKPQSRH